jgi:hypothetical protein
VSARLIDIWVTPEKNNAGPSKYVVKIKSKSIDL